MLQDTLVWNWLNLGKHLDTNYCAIVHIIIKKDFGYDLIIHDNTLILDNMIVTTVKVGVLVGQSRNASL